MQKATNEIACILGLGNPGPEYTHTYHNAGALFITHLAGPDAIFNTPPHKRFEFIKNEGIVLAKPHTYMNESGLATSQIIDYFSLEPARLCIAHDDTDLEIGSFKITFDQNSGGHNGINSTIDTLGTTQFWRIKIGVRDPRQEPRQKAGDFVLSSISSEHAKKLEEVFDQIAQELKKSSA